MECGKIFLAIENLAQKGRILVNCSFCDGHFEDFNDYTNHLLIEHYPQLELEDRNYQNIKEEKKHESVENNAEECSTDFIKFLQMDLKYDTETMSDLHKPTYAYAKSEEIMFAEESKTKITKKKNCPHCSRKFFLSSSLKHHLKNHRGPNSSSAAPHICKICNSGFQLRFSLKLHLREHKANSEQTINEEGKGTSKTLKRKLNFAQSLIKDASKTPDVKEMSYVVVENILSPTNASNNARAITYQVSKDPALEFAEFHCEKCNKKFCGQSRFNSHMNRHKPCEFKCETCFKGFKTAGELQTHTRFHTGERPYLCSSCGEKFATVSKLHNHTRRHHTFERTKQCPMCEKNFFGSGELKVHLQATHSDVRPYKCTLCPSTFNRQFSLRTHMKSHENKREYKCNLCSASFNQKCNLTAHKKKTHCLLMDEEIKV